MGLSLPKRFYRNRLGASASRFEKVLIERLEAVVDGMRLVCPKCHEDFEKSCGTCDKRFVKDAHQEPQWSWTSSNTVGSATTLTTPYNIIGSP